MAQAESRGAEKPRNRRKRRNGGRICPIFSAGTKNVLEGKRTASSKPKENEKNQQGAQGPEKDRKSPNGRENIREKAEKTAPEAQGHQRKALGRRKAGSSSKRRPRKVERVEPRG